MAPDFLYPVTINEHKNTGATCIDKTDLSLIAY